MNASKTAQFENDHKALIAHLTVIKELQEGKADVKVGASTTTASSVFLKGSPSYMGIKPTSNFDFSVKCITNKLAQLAMLCETRDGIVMEQVILADTGDNNHYTCVFKPTDIEDTLKLLQIFMVTAS